MEKKVLLGSYEAVKTELEEAKKKPEILREKVTAADKRLTELKVASDVAKRRKEQALVAFASGDITEDELKTARSSLERVINEKAEVEEFLGASEKASRQLQKRILDLSVKLNGCRHEFWNAVAEELKNKIPSNVITQIYAVYGSRLLAGGAGSYENFLRQLFPMPRHDEVQIIEKELTKQFGFVE